MNYKPNISVIVPTFNEEKYIKDALVSVKQQKCDLSYEVIVVDGESTDNTVSIAQNFTKVYISPKKGKANQLNFGISKTSGELVIFFLQAITWSSKQIMFR